MLSDRDELAKSLVEAGAVMIDLDHGFTHTSGRQAPIYVDIRKILGAPYARSMALDRMQVQIAQTYGRQGPDAFAGGETAGIPYAAFIAERFRPGFGVPMVYVRKKPKGHGRQARIEGFLPDVDGGDPDVVLIEDLATDGASKVDFINALREAGVRVTNVYAVLVYGQTAVDDVAAHGAQLTGGCWMDDVLRVGHMYGYIRDEEDRAVREFLQGKLTKAA